MKSNSKNRLFEKYKIHPPNKDSESRLLNYNSISGNISLEVKAASFFQKIQTKPIPSVYYQPTKINKNSKNLTDNNLRPTKYYTSLNKEYFKKDYHMIQPNKQDESITYEDIINRTNINLRPFALNSQSIDDSQSRISKNNKNNVEDKKYPSNYSYFEYKYTKKKKKEPDPNMKNTISISISHNSENFRNNILINNKFYSSKENNVSNSSLKQNLNRSHIIGQINNSPLKNKILESHYYKLQKDKINTLVNSTTIQDSQKKNLFFKHSFNNTISNNYDNNQSYIPININNTFIKSTVPRTPLIYSQFKISSPVKNDKGNINNTVNKIKTERIDNFPSKSEEKMTFKKLIFNNAKNKNLIKYKKKIEKASNKTPSITQPFKLSIEKMSNSPRTEKTKNFTKSNTSTNTNISTNTNSINNTNIINKSNNKVLITITNFKDKKKDSQINNNNPNYKSYQMNNSKSKVLVQDHIKTESNMKTKIDSKSPIKDDLNLANIKKKKKSIIQGLKILNTNKIKKANNNNEDYYTNYTNNNKFVEISELNSSRNEKKSQKNSNIKKGSLNTEEETDYFKEVSNIMYDHNTEPRNTIQYNTKENKNKKISLSKGRIEQINEKKNLILKNKNTDSKTIDKNKIKNDFNTISISILNNNTIYNRRFSNDAIHNNSFNFLSQNMKKSNSNSKIQKTNNPKITKTEQKKNSKLIVKKLNQLEKEKIKNLSNSLNNEKESPTKKQKEKGQKAQSENTKFESRSSRVDEIPKKSRIKKKGTEEEWDKYQFMGMRKKTYDPSFRQKKNNLSKKEKKSNSLNEAFSSTIYVKSSEGLSIPGKNEFGHKKTNQDTLLIERNVNGVLNFNIFGVLDGHGEEGHYASQFVSRYIFHRIKNHPSIKKQDEPKQIYHKLKENSYKIIANIFLDADVQIQKEKFDVNRSGTTCVIVIQLEEHIICANTGDSRAIMVYDQNNDDNLVNSKVFPLSYDCKPDLPNELKRIKACGGMVEKAYDPEIGETGPYRVWAEGEDYPGLAMSRSIGDMDAKKCGVIPNPQIVEYIIDQYTKYMIVASDGIWEFISNEQVMKFCNKFYLRNDPVGLCQELSQKSISLWEKNDCAIDDITVAVVFF